MFVAHRADLFDHHAIHLGGEVVVGFQPGAAPNLIGQWRAFMHVEQVKR